MSEVKIVRTDIRIIWGLILVLVFYFLVYPFSLPIGISKETRAVYDTINELPPGSVILFSGSVVATDPDTYYGILAMMNYIPETGHKLILFSLIDKSPIVFEEAIETTNLYDKMEYGVEVVNLGFVPGAEVAIRDFTADVWGSVGGLDWYGTPLEDIPLMADVRDIHDIDLVISVHGANPGTPEWVTQMQAPYDKPFIAMATAAGYTSQLPFYRSGALLGITKGARGTAELEVLTGIPGPATTLMSSQSAGHTIILACVILANVKPYIGFGKKEEES